MATLRLACSFIDQRFRCQTRGTILHHNFNLIDFPFSLKFLFCFLFEIENTLAFSIKKYININMFFLPWSHRDDGDQK